MSALPPKNGHEAATAASPFGANIRKWLAHLLDTHRSRPDVDSFWQLCDSISFSRAALVLHSLPHSKVSNALNSPRQHSQVLAAALPRAESEAFLVARDHAIATLAAADLRAAIRSGRALLARLPLRSQRTPVQKAAGEAIVHLTADAVWRFFRRHAVPMYRELTREGVRSIRVDALLWEAAARWPDILPAQAELTAESDACRPTRTASKFTRACSSARSWPIHRQGIT